MKVFKIGIRHQLMCLVLFVALFSLMVMAVITGVYFSENYKSIRADRLEVIAQMKASQIQQNLNFLYYQAIWLGARDSVQKSLLSYRAGNTSESNWNDAEDTVRQFLISSFTFTNVRIYDTKYTQVIDSSRNWSNQYVLEDLYSVLFPLDDEQETLPESLDTSGIVTGPVANDTTFVMSMTMPIYASASILFESTEIAGYVTTIMTAQSLVDILNDTAIDKGSIVILKANTSESEVSVDGTYSYALPSYGKSPDILDKYYSIKDSYIANQVLRLLKTGSATATKNEDGAEIAAGFSPVEFNLTKWAAVIEQPRNSFLEPSNRLTRIIIGVCFGTALFLGLITFPLAHWAVQPILSLQKATEMIAMGRGLTNGNGKYKKDPDSGTGSNRVSVSSSRLQSPLNPYESHDNNNRSFITQSDENTRGSSSSNRATYMGQVSVPTYSRIFQDELSMLTETFNVMTDELDRQYSQLEDRVRARTKQLEAAKISAEAANEAKTVFIANISHELRTPLNGILGMTAIAMAENDQSKIQQSLKLIFRSGELLLHILTELLTFSKNSLKRSKLENSEFSVMEVALQIKSIFGKLAKDQHVNLSINVEPIEVRRMILYGDSNRIIQVVMNLVSNSLKFTPVDGKVSVIIRMVGEYDEFKSQETNYEKVLVQKSSIPTIVEEPLKDPSCQYTDSSHETTATFNNSEDHTNSNIVTDGVSHRNANAGGFTVDSNDNNNNNNNDNNFNEKNIQSDINSHSDNNINDDNDESFEKVSAVTAASTNNNDNIIGQYRLLDSNQKEYKQTREISPQRTWVFEFTVEDTGPGIDPEMQSSVFEPFVQGDQTLSRQYGGTGLGLSICKQLASMMNGDMQLESTVGVGSKFTFTVPLVQKKEYIFTGNNTEIFEDEFNPNSKKHRKVKIVEPERRENSDHDTTSSRSSSSTSYTNEKNDTVERDSENGGVIAVPGDRKSLNKSSAQIKDEEYLDKPILQSTGTAKTSSLPTFNSQSSHNNIAAKLKILVAEDNIVNQEVIKRMLSLEGFSDIEMAVDGEEAIHFVQSNLKAKEEPSTVTEGHKEHYDVIFMDVQMPKCDGLEATKQIRLLGYNGPIVALTAFADESNVKECLDAGMSGFLSKPIRRAQLRDILVEFCPVLEQDTNDEHRRRENRYT